MCVIERASDRMLQHGGDPLSLIAPFHQQRRIGRRGQCTLRRYGGRKEGAGDCVMLCSFLHYASYIPFPACYQYLAISGLLIHPNPPSSDCHSTLIYRFTTHSKPIETTSNRARGSSRQTHSSSLCGGAITAAAIGCPD